MKPTILIEVQAFLKKHGIPASVLADSAGVSRPVLTRLLSGARKDVKSCTADALRLAMRDYECAHQTYLQQDGGV
jgi:hypothetical protein